MVKPNDITQTYSELISRANIPTFTTTIDGKFIEVNQAFLEKLEFRHSEILEVNAIDLFKDKGDRDKMKSTLAKNGYYNDLLLTLETKSGRTKYFLETAIQLEHPSYKIIYQGFLFDITDQIEAEERLNILDRGIEQAPVSVILWNIDDKILYVNPRFVELSGYTHDEIVGKSPRILGDDLHSDEEYEQIAKTIMSGKVWFGNFRNIRPDGVKYVVETTIIPIRNRNDDLTHFLSIQQDVTSKLQQEGELRESENKFRLLFNSANVGIVLTHNQIIKDVNSYFTTMIGYKPEELIGNNFELITHPDDILMSKEMIKVMHLSGSVKNSEKRYLKKDGSIVWGSISVSKISISGKIYAIASIVDITNRKLAEEKQKRMEKNILQATKFEAIGRLSGNIAHDFNNLLTIIMNNNELIRMISKNPQIQSYVEDIERASTHGAKIIANLLKYSRQSPVKKDIIEIHSVLNEVINMLGAGLKAKINLTTNLLDLDILVEGNNSDLSASFMNIGLNAIEALGDEGGTVTFTTHKLNNMVWIIIKDTGLGMGQYELDHIFDPFFSTKDDGTGLGLSSALGIINDHQGAIKVNSTKGKGTEFIIQLPILNSTKQSRTEDKQLLVNSSGEKLHLMVVDDEVPILFSFSDYFTMKHYRVSSFSRSNKALEFYKESFNDVDLVILDLKLKDETGIEIMVKLKEINPRVRIIFYSGYLDIQQQFSEDDNVLAILTKPMNLSKLEQRLQELYTNITY